MPVYNLNFILERYNLEDALKNVPSQLERFYCHVTKFTYQKYKQSGSWIESINNSSKEIMKYLYDKNKKKINENAYRSVSEK